MTIAQALKLAIAKLTTGRIADLPRLEAEILLSETLKKPREFILAHGERKLTKSQIKNYGLKIKKRLKGLPLAYITGEKEFYGLKFKVDKNVLIPRPETELMVEEALKLATRSAQRTVFIDIGTGSGCVIIALAKQIREGEFLAIDASAKALAVAKQNAKRHGVAKKIKFFKGNLLEPIFRNKPVIGRRPLAVLANLPYLTPAQIKNSPTIKYEPKSALGGGSDGLKYYRRLIKQIKALRVTPCALCGIYAFCEIGAGQSAKIKKLVKRELPQAICQIKKDLSGLNRLAVISIDNQSKSCAV